MLDDRGSAMTGRELLAVEVLTDLFEEMLIANPLEIARQVIKRLHDAGFVVIAAEDPRLHREAAR
jgi:hypothetical protein